MYFEDIFDKVKPLWKECFSLNEIQETETFIKDIKQEYNRIERIVDFSDNENYTEWESMLVFTIYQALTAFAINKWNKEKINSISINEVPIGLFEEYFRKNLEPEDEFEGNMKYLSHYKGFRLSDRTDL